MRRVLCSPALLASVAVQKGAGKWPLFNDAWAREHRWGRRIDATFFNTWLLIPSEPGAFFGDVLSMALCI